MASAPSRTTIFRSATRTRALLAGFNYDAGRWRVTGGFQAIDLERSATRINEYVIGAAYWLNPKNLVLVNHAATYEPGKAQHKTSVYGAIGYMDNGKAYDNYFDLKLQPGQSSNNLMAGLKHNF
ncbi:MAG: hypothetical protein ACXWVD_02580 [Telluria sp.]